VSTGFYQRFPFAHFPEQRNLTGQEESKDVLPVFKILSSKGQLVLPAAYRKRMGLSAGSRIRIIEDGERLILEPVVRSQGRVVEV